MNKRHSSQAFYLLALIFLFSVSSCTYDYFEDETNYEIYVPKADRNLRTDTYSIEDLSIFIFNETLVKDRYSHNPFTENARSMAGNFNFRLFPGTYSVYCFTNVQDIYFQNLNTYNEARFDLQQYTDGFYKEPSAIYVDYKEPTIEFPGPVLSETAYFEQKYVGQICIAFKNLTQLSPSLTKANIKEIQIEASGIGVTQYLSALTTIENTRSSRLSADNKMKLASKPFDVDYKDFEFGVQNNYYPSPDLSAEGRENEPIVLKLKFVGQSGEMLYDTFTVGIKDKTGKPIVLHMNEILIVEVDGNNVQVLRLDDPEQWNPKIESEDESRPGGGGIGV